MSDPALTTSATGRSCPPSCALTSKPESRCLRRSISRRHVESLSSATIRNVMAELEEQGFLYQPHTSAGRVPTATAYRFFAQQIVARATLSPEDEERIRGEFAGASTGEEIAERAGHVLAEISKGLGIVVSPPISKTVLEHIRFVLLPDGRIVVVLVSTGGNTRDKVIRPEKVFAQQDLDHTAEYLNHHYTGFLLEAIRADLVDAAGPRKRSGTRCWRGTRWCFAIPGCSDKARAARVHRGRGADGCRAANSTTSRNCGTCSQPLRKSTGSLRCWRIASIRLIPCTCRSA